MNSHDHTTLPKELRSIDQAPPPQRPTRAEAEQAVHTLIRWAGDDPEREGLLGTPDRVVRAYEEFFSGYDQDPMEILQRTFEETDGYDEIVLLRDIRLESHCEHHMVPILGKAHVAYLPSRRVVGISKLARVVEIKVWARRFRAARRAPAPASPRAPAARNRRPESDP